MLKAFKFFVLLLWTQVSLYGEMTWGTPENISPNQFSASSIHLAMNAAGTTAAIWIDSGTQIFVATKPLNGNWSEPELIGNSDGANFAQIAIDSLGNMLAIWRDLDGSNYIVNSSYYSAGSWTFTTLTPSPHLNITSLSLSMNEAGDAFATWIERDVSATVQAIQFTSGAWVLPSVTLSNGSDAQSSFVGVDAAGNGYATWASNGAGGTFIVYLSKFIAGSGWQDAIELSDNSADSRVQDLSVNATGNYIVAYIQDDGEAPNIMKVSSCFSSTISSGIVISGPGVNSSGGIVQLDNQGYATIVYYQDGTGLLSRSNTGSYSTIWDSALLVSSDTSSQVHCFSMDSNRTGVILFNIGMGGVQAAEKPFGNPWENFVTLSTNSGGVIAVTANVPKMAIAAWNGPDSNFNEVVYASTGIDADAPTGLQGRKIHDDFGTVSNITNKLKWDTSSSASAYHIYRDGSFIARVDGEDPHYQDPNRTKGVLYQYEVRAITSSGVESLSATVTVQD